VRIHAARIPVARDSATRSINVAFVNVYEDSARAEAYSKLEFANTYYLAYRDLPEIAVKYAPGRTALDFGCGTGRSSRFLERLGFEATGVDISEEMLRNARETDPSGDYRHVADGDLGPLAPGYDLALSAFTFDNIPAEERLFPQIIDAIERSDGNTRSPGSSSAA
jgi:SAM-dependent methyltransferase